MSNITNLNRDYLIKINVKEATIDVPKMTFWNTDKKTSNMFVQLVINMSTNELISQYVTVQNATDYKITLNVIKPKTKQYKTIEATLLNEEKALFEIDLTSEFIDQVGNYNFEFEVSSKVDNNDESITTSSSTYEVKGSILTNLNEEISSSPDLPILKQLIEQVKSLQGGDLTGYQKKEDETLETTSKKVVGAINEVNSQFKDIANIGTKEKLNGKFKSTTLEGILLEIYNKIYTQIPQVTNPLSIQINGLIPEINFVADDWSSMTKKDKIVAESSIDFNNLNWQGYAELNWQGNSSLAYDKKNLTAKFFEDKTKTKKQKFNIKIDDNHKEWGIQNKFCFKANTIDHSHGRNIIGARLWNEIVRSRSDYNSLPQELRESPNNCVIDGFPVKVTVNGVYQGIYTWNIPKDAWMFNMDDTNPNHAVLCAEQNNNGNNNLSTACEFRENANINGTDWSLEIPDILNNDIKVSFNELINCIKNTTDNQFIHNIEKYLDIQSAIDYYIFQYYICGLDGLAKNLIMMTYDGTKWLCSSYDMDSTFGLYFDGSRFVNSNYQCPEQYQETNSLLWQRIEKCFAKKLKERYTKLRTNILSVEHITKLFNDFMSIIGNELYAADLKAYPSIPQGNINHLQQITDFVTARSTYVDSEINALVEYDFSQVPVTTLDLDKQNINLNMPSNIQNVDLSSITKYSGREIYNNVENTTSDTSKILTDFIDIDYNKINIYMSDSANDSTRFGYYSSKEDNNPSSTIKIVNAEGNGYIYSSAHPCIKLMSNDNFANEKLISIDKNYIESMLKDMDLSSLDSSINTDKYIPVTVSKGDVVFCKPSKAGYWNAIGTTNNGLGNVQNNNTANLIVYPINNDTTTVYIKIQNNLLTSDATLKYAILHSKDLKVNTAQNITATLSPSDATNQNVTWTTDNANVELVPNGLNCTVKAKAIGSSVITCTSEDTTNGTISDTCNIIIN